MHFVTALGAIDHDAIDVRTMQFELAVRLIRIAVVCRLEFCIDFGVILLHVIIHISKDIFQII